MHRIRVKSVLTASIRAPTTEAQTCPSIQENTFSRNCSQKNLPLMCRTIRRRIRPASPCTHELCVMAKQNVHRGICLESVERTWGDRWNVLASTMNNNMPPRHMRAKSMRKCCTLAPAAWLSMCATEKDGKGHFVHVAGVRTLCQRTARGTPHYTCLVVDAIRDIYSPTCVHRA